VNEVITLIMYIVARGFMRSGQGNPDEARAARYILKDYVNGKLLFCHPPPGVAEANFNQPTYKNTLSRLASKKHAPLTRVGKDSDTYVPYSASMELPARPGGIRSLKIDQEFFESDHSVRNFLPFMQQNGKEFSRTTLYPHQNSVASDGTLIDPDQARLLSLRKADTSKKHKKMKRVKQRSGKGYDV
jgi:large subunit GTPase 1